MEKIKLRTLTPSRTPLFNKNLELLLSLNSNLTEDEIDIDQAWELSKGVELVEEAKNWQLSDKKVPSLVRINVQNYTDEYAEETSKFFAIPPNQRIYKSIDLHQDYHIFEGLIRMRKTLKEKDLIATSSHVTASGPIKQLVAFGAGDGMGLMSMMNTFEPQRLVLLVDTWNALISSFWKIDWKEIYAKYQEKPYGITIARVKSEDQVLNHSTQPSMLMLENTYCYFAQKASEELINFSKVLWSDRPSNLFAYLGYTIDEYNMVINTANTLAKNPRVMSTFKKNRLDVPWIVCGSGPSLDGVLEKIKEVKDNAIIIAGGSNYKTLLDAGIEPDFLSLVERAEEVLQDYEKVYDIHGKTKTILVMSGTCPHGLMDLFKTTIIYHRPALTPLSIFSSNNKEVLYFEGPESVNTATAVAQRFGASSIYFAGVDLGTADKNYDRSIGATGKSNRSWDREKEGNFQDIVYTNKAQEDALWSLEASIQTNKDISYYNVSNGVKISGAKATKSDELLKLAILPAFDKDELITKLIKRMSTRSKDQVKADWESRKPRQQMLNLKKELNDLIHNCSDIDDINFISKYDELLALAEVNRKKQIPRRVIRSTMLKLLLMLLQQKRVLKSQLEPIRVLKYDEAARSLLSDMLKLLSDEYYALCDYVDNL